MLVAGGWESPSVETIDLVTKAVTRGREMAQPRGYFQLAAFGEEDYKRVLALGGDSGLAALSSVEWLQEENGEWQEAAGRLAMARSHAGVVAVTAQMLNCTSKCVDSTQGRHRLSVPFRLLEIFLLFVWEHSK